jgi:hypothetical protein
VNFGSASFGSASFGFMNSGEPFRARAVSESRPTAGVFPSRYPCQRFRPLILFVYKRIVSRRAAFGTGKF